MRPRWRRKALEALPWLGFALIGFAVGWSLAW